MNLKRKEDKSTKNFGYLVSFVFLILALYPIIKANSINILFLSLSVLFFIITIFLHQILDKPAYLWYQLGYLLHKVISPIIMLVVYIFSIVLIAFIMKIFRKDPLEKKFNNKIKSYWVIREKLVKTDFNLNDQF